MKKWKNTSNRKHFESFELATSDLRLNITNGHINAPGEWVLNCGALNISVFGLNAKTPLEAKLSAVKEVKMRLIKMVNGLGEILKPEK